MSLFYEEYSSAELVEKMYRINLVNEIINQKCPVYIFGTNDFSRSIAAHIDVKGFINDKTSELSFLNKPIISLENINESAIVISCVVLARPRFALEKIKNYTQRVVDYFFFQKYSGLELPNVIFEHNQIFAHEFYKNESKYYELYLKLEDLESKETLKNIILFRLSSDLKYLSGFKYLPEQQYFDNCVVFSDNEVFLDVGCFDGHTSLEFAKNSKNYKKIYVFEPDENNIRDVQRNLSVLENKVIYNKCGLSKVKESLKFDSAGSSSKINFEGEFSIDVFPLDELNIPDATYIKMDIEGAELCALEGAKQTIINCHPKLAISVYHKIDDLLTIPEMILSFKSDYRIYLRHYTEGATETVMYFIPRN